MRRRLPSPPALLIGLALAVGAVGAAEAVGTPGRAVPPRDDALISALGCGGCHDGLAAPDAARAAAPPLGPGAPELPAGFVFEWLADPVPRRPEIVPSRMPDFGLSEGERVALALFLGSGDRGPALTAAMARHPDRDAGVGREVFRALACGSCHSHPEGTPTGVAPALGNAAERLRPDWVRSWLARPTPVRPAHLAGARMPDFRLTDDERDALTTALTGADGREGDEVDAGPAPGGADIETAGVPGVRAARAGRLLETRYACRGCHVVAGRGGRIGPSLDGVSRRLKPEFVARMIADPAGAAPGSAMPRQPMPPREVRILADYLLGLDAGGEGADAGAPGRTPAVMGGAAVGAARPEPAGEGSNEVVGAALYATWCAACHGDAGEGDGWNAAALPVPPTVHADPEALAPRPDDVLYDGIHGGGWVLGRSPGMPAFGELLTPGQIDALVAHLRTLCDCEGPAWSRDGGGP